MSDNIFGNLTNEAEGETDSLGGGFIVESGVYDTVIELAYADKSTGGAQSINLHLKTASGALVRVQEYITSGTAKGGLHTYKDKKTGEVKNLPGYNKMDAMVKLAGIADGIAGLKAETKVVNRYDFDAKKEVPMATQVLVGLMDQPITAGVLKQVVDKNKKDANGVYQPTGETREENVIDKFFRTRDGMTVSEILAGATQPAFKAAWAKKNDGVTRQLAIGVGSAGAASGATSGAPLSAGEKPASLFGNGS